MPLLSAASAVTCPRPCGRGGFKQGKALRCYFRGDVPAHAGGVDLSPNHRVIRYGLIVPAHAGGVDLSLTECFDCHVECVPAHAGGVDLSVSQQHWFWFASVPAHAGGVDLSLTQLRQPLTAWSPRPCGRGGFKLRSLCQSVPAHSVPAHAGGVDLSS